MNSTTVIIITTFFRHCH